MNYTLFDAFTGISPFEKFGIIQFLEKNTGAAKANIQHAVDYAIKDCPSFGGFVLSVSENDTPVAVAVVNKTGMGGYQSKNLLAYFAVAPTWQHPDILKSFFLRLLEVANGDLSFNLSFDDPIVPILEEMGFAIHAVEMRFTPQTIRLAV